jgi:hypothetical protein
MAIVAPLRWRDTELGLQAASLTNFCFRRTDTLVRCASHVPVLARSAPRMINYSALELLHRHDDGSAVPMTEHGLEEHDPERALLRGIRRGARLFRCEVCADEVIVQPTVDPSEEGSA